VIGEFDRDVVQRIDFIQEVASPHGGEDALVLTNREPRVQQVDGLAIECIGDVPVELALALIVDAQHALHTRAIAVLDLAFRPEP